MMQLKELLAGVNITRVDDWDAVVENVSFFAEDIVPGWVYVACKLPWMDGNRAVGEAAARGAAAVVIDAGVSLPLRPACNTVVVPDTVKAYSTMCANFFGNVHRRMSIHAVTGTKGKTSTCYLLESIFRSAGFKTGLIGTISQRIDGREVASVNTTPLPYELHRTLREMHDAGVTHLVLEVSSIGIAEERIWGLQCDGMVFTNLGHEHLTYHGGLEGYRQAKSRLFTEYAAAGKTVCAINVDDPFGTELASLARGEVVTYGLNGEVCGSSIVLSSNGVRGEAGGVRIRSSLLGSHNAYNILGAVALTRAIGIPPEAIADGISRLISIPGRLERVENENGVDIFVDYAHTPESVLTVLLTLRALFAAKRLVVILGCGGNSDRAKRPLMARLAVENSDACILTSDNPRAESPAEIIKDMLAGVRPERSGRRGRPEVVIDRREAIYRGVEAAGVGGTLVILGKGHERFQHIGNEAIPFDDREVAVQALRHGVK